MKWKVIIADNFGRGGEGPGHDDKLIVDGLTEEQANKVAEALNVYTSDHSSAYYRAVKDTYKLQTWEP